MIADASVVDMIGQLRRNMLDMQIQLLLAKEMIAMLERENAKLRKEKKS